MVESEARVIRFDNVVVDDADAGAGEDRDFDDEDFLMKKKKNDYSKRLPNGIQLLF